LKLPPLHDFHQDSRKVQPDGMISNSSPELKL